MNLSEFKAWFDGFTESLDRLPNKKQWARIREKVDEITPDPTPWPIFVARSVRPYQPWWGQTYFTTNCGTYKDNTNATLAITSNSGAWQHVGRCEAADMSAGA